GATHEPGVAGHHFRHVNLAIELAELRHGGGVRVGRCIHAHPVHKRVCEGLLHHSISYESGNPSVPLPFPSMVSHGWSMMPTTVHIPWPTSIRPKLCGNIRASSISQGKRIWKLREFSVTVAASFTARSLLHYWRTLYGYTCVCLVSGAFCHVD